VREPGVSLDGNWPSGVTRKLLLAFFESGINEGRWGDVYYGLGSVLLIVLIILLLIWLL
jgi:hypothetical protein